MIETERPPVESPDPNPRMEASSMAKGREKGKKGKKNKPKLTPKEKKERGKKKKES